MSTYPASQTAPGQRGAIKTGWVLLIVVLAVAAVFSVSQYNTLVNRQEKLRAAWGEIDNQYKRRFELIPNLVETVKGAANFEQETLEKVTAARAAVSRAQLPSDLPTDEAKLQAYLKAQQELSGALSRLIVVAEQYPQLRATENFRALQDQLEGTDNRITVARGDYITAVRQFNAKVRSFPTNLVAGLFGFEAAAQPAVEAVEREAPKVDFGTKAK
jgi:LemA protein